MAHPIATEHPGTIAELVSVVKQAAATGRRLKVRGAGHSGQGMASTDGVLIVLDNYRRVLRVDRERRQVTVQAGITLGQLAREMAGWGLELADVGGRPGQTVGGAVSTGSHGHGAGATGLASWVTGLDLVTADGSLVSCSAGEQPDIFDAARVGLGALGAISTVTLQCGPGFNLRSVTGALSLSALLDHFDGYMDANDHTEAVWIPPTGLTLVHARNRTAEPSGRVRHGYVDRGYRVYPAPLRLPEPVMEYSLPRSSAVPILRQMQELVAGDRRALPFPVRLSVAAADRLPMSAGAGRPSVFIGLGRRGARLVEELMDEAGARPQWGRLGHHTAATLRPRFAGWDAWQAVRRRLDPDGRFTNDWTERVLGHTSGHG